MLGSFPALPGPNGFPRRSFLPALFLILLVVLGGAGFIWFTYSRNPYTPAGYVGYLTRGAVLGRAQFVGLQTGPTSTGRGWLLDVTNVSVTPYTYTEDFNGGDNSPNHTVIYIPVGSMGVPLVGTLNAEAQSAPPSPPSTPKPNSQTPPHP